MSAHWWPREEKRVSNAQRRVGRKQLRGVEELL